MTDRTRGENRTAVDPAQLNSARKTLTALSAMISSSRSSSTGKGASQLVKQKTR